MQNITFRNAYSAVRQTSTSNYGGGAIFDEGGQLKVVNSAFLNNRCYKNGPDLGGAAIRARGMYMGSPIYITHDTFSGNTPGGGSGGAIYTDGNHYNLIIDGTLMRDNTAREGGGAIFFVVDAQGGTLKIEYSTLHHNPSGVSQNAPGIFDSVDGKVTKPVVIHSAIS